MRKFGQGLEGLRMWFWVRNRLVFYYTSIAEKPTVFCALGRSFIIVSTWYCFTIHFTHSNTYYLFIYLFFICITFISLFMYFFIYLLFYYLLIYLSIHVFIHLSTLLFTYSLFSNPWNTSTSPNTSLWLRLRIQLTSN